MRNSLTSLIRRRVNTWFRASSSIAALILAGCGSPGDSPSPANQPEASRAEPTEAPKPPTSPSRTQVLPAGTHDVPLTGIVVAVDREAGLVTIDHRDIPGVMPAMAMDFQPTDRSALEDVQPGDEVEATLRVESDGTRLTGFDLRELAVTVPAIADPGAPEAAPVLEPGALVPDVTLTTQDGSSLRLSDLRGRVVVLTFVYTRCPLPTYCPLMDQRFREIANQVGSVKSRADEVRLLSISFDSTHDTPAILTEHARRVGARPPLWTYSVAPTEELRKIAEPLGLLYLPRSGEIVHSLSTAVIGPDGRLVRLERGNTWTAADLLATIRGLIPGAKGSPDGGTVEAGSLSPRAR